MDRETQYWAVLLLICIASIVPACAQPVSINFQPPGEVPAGYLPDFGEVFGDRGNGFSYGWTADQSDETANRQSSSFADLRYDTMVYCFPASSEAWEIALENGVYDLFIVGGDPRNAYQNNTLEVEGVILTDPDFGDRLDEYRIAVPVQDGLLTIRSRSSDGTLCFVDVSKHAPRISPFPEDSSDRISHDVLLHWTPAGTGQKYNLYFGESFEDLNAATIPVAAGLDVNTFDPGQLEFGKTYYWRVDEVNSVEPQAVHPGPVWSFATRGFVIVDDFESYNNFSPNRPFQTWLDHWGYSVDEFFPEGHSGNGTGVGIGYDFHPWLGFSEFSLMEEEITIPRSSQSLPFYYGYSNFVISQTDRTFDPPQDWSTDGSRTLVLHFYGRRTNTVGSLYALINGQKVVYPDKEDLKRTMWHVWPIDLATLETNLEVVTSLSIGVEGSGTGLLLLDDILLFPETYSYVAVKDPGMDGLVAMYTLDGHTLDVSGHGHDGVVHGAPTYGGAVADKGLVLDGSGGQYVDLGSLNPSEGTGQFTVSMWVKRTGYTYTPAYQGVMGKRDAWSSEDMMWQIEVNQNNGVISLARPDEQVAGKTQGLPPRWWVQMGGTPDKWAHLGVTYDGDTARLYVSGLEAGSGPFTLGPDTDAALVLGACGANGENPFYGVIDEVVIYGRVLSLGEVRYLAGDR